MDTADPHPGFQILSRLSLANLAQARVDLDCLFDSVLTAPPATDVYLQLLEQARLPLGFIQDHFAQSYANKSLPLDESEEDAFQHVVAMWRKISFLYADCARQHHWSSGNGSPERAALIFHRCIYYTGIVIFEHHRARRALPAGLWLELHRYYANAEKWGLTTVVVPDAIDHTARGSHCAALIAGLILVELAGSYSLPVRDLMLVRRWSIEWAHLVAIHPFGPEEALPLLVIDLGQDSGLSVMPDRTRRENLRRIDVSLLRQQIGHVRSLLKEHVIPAEFVADSDCSVEHFGRLLKNLARPWSLFRPARSYRRHKARGPSKVCAGIEAIHYFVSGMEFAQPTEASSYSRQDFDALFAFRRTIQTTQPMVYRQGSLGLACETWETLDQSATGFRLMRASFGKRIEPGQLLAIRASDSEAYLLVRVAWLMQERTGALLAGLAALPGKPQAVAVRRVWQQSGSAVPFERGFLLPAVPAINAEQTIILPPGWFHPNSLMEVYTDKSWRVRLVRLLADGPDFERATFVAS